MDGFPEFAEEAYKVALENKIFFESWDVELVYRLYDYVAFIFRSGAELRIYDDGTIKYWAPGSEAGIVLREAEEVKVNGS